MTVLQVLTNVFFFAALIPANLSVVVFHVRTRGDWWDTEDGQHVMSYMAAVAFVLDLTLVFAVWRPAWMLWVAPFAWLLLAVVIIWRLMLILDGWKLRPPGRRRK